MVNAHLSVGIAQVVFYVPVLPLAAFVLVKNWRNPPRAAWYPLLTFCILRLAGGIISIVRDSTNPDDIGLIIAAAVLLNIGLIPLLMALMGMIRVTLDPNSRAHLFVRFVRLIFLTAVILLVVAGGLSSEAPTTSKAQALTQAAYVMLAVILGLATLELLYLLTQKHRISPSGYYYVPFALLSVPFLAVRTAYGLLYAFTVDNLYSTWNPLYGSAVAFALMCLLAEYFALLIFLYLGFHRMRHPLHPPHVKETMKEAARGSESPRKKGVFRRNMV